MSGPSILSAPEPHGFYFDDATGERGALTWTGAGDEVRHPCPGPDVAWDAASATWIQAGRREIVLLDEAKP